VNPGRDAAYERLSGRDPEVVRYMEGNADTHAFFDAVSRLVDAQVQTYVARGFTSLDVHFGCTGGQHRSVYFAERLAAHLRRAFPDVGVMVRHTEETRWRRETP
jgi:RNase adaptor protein for sRNA GlmZ degradation